MVHKLRLLAEADPLIWTMGAAIVQISPVLSARIAPSFEKTASEECSLASERCSCGRHGGEDGDQAEQPRRIEVLREQRGEITDAGGWFGISAVCRGRGRS